MTEQEQKAFNQMREALESSAVCIQLMSDGPSRASWGDTLDIIDAAITAANAVSEQPQAQEMRDPLDLGQYVNGANISANDKPVAVIEKLQAVINERKAHHE